MEGLNTLWKLMETNQSVTAVVMLPAFVFFVCTVVLGMWLWDKNNDYKKARRSFERLKQEWNELKENTKSSTVYRDRLRQAITSEVLYLYMNRLLTTIAKGKTPHDQAYEFMGVLITLWSDEPSESGAFHSACRDLRKKGGQFKANVDFTRSATQGKLILTFTCLVKDKGYGLPREFRL